MNTSISPHGGDLKSLYLSGEALIEENEKAKFYPSWTLTERQLCDVELLLNGAFSPLEGFMGETDYKNVLENIRLKNGLLWSMPITLDVSPNFASSLGKSHRLTPTNSGIKIALRDAEGTLIATMDVTDNWQPDKQKEAMMVFETQDEKHPAVHYLFHQAGLTYLGGKLNGIERVRYYDFNDYRHTPIQIRQLLKENNWRHVIAFQTRNPLHRAHVEMVRRAATTHNAHLAIQAVVGMTKPGDVDHYTRVRCYQHIVKKHLNEKAFLTLLPLAMRMGGPREALWHAIIRKNYGFSHFIVGRDHAGPGKDSRGNAFYEPYQAQDLLKHHQKEIGITMIPFKEMVYVKNKALYNFVDEVEENDEVLNVSGTELRHYLHAGVAIPEWFSYPEVITELRRAYPKKHLQGLTLFFTGLSGSGKSTIANALMAKLLERGDKKVTLLDGDVVRQNLSSELGFSKEHRDLNIARIGYVASEITKNGGIAICAQIAPYAEARSKVRDLISRHGGFIEIYVSTPLSECERRDPKGLYAKARSGLIKYFTGIDDPYEEPTQPDITINTVNQNIEDAVNTLLFKLSELGYLPG